MQEFSEVHILVAGESPDNLNTTREAVGQRGYLIVPAPSMSLALYLAHKNFPHIIVCNEKMTDGSGREFLAELKADAELAEIPFIFLLHHEDDSLAKEALAMGAVLVLSQPLQPQELMVLMSPYIQGRMKTREPRPEETPE